MTSLVDAEERAREDADSPTRLTKEDLKRAERNGLIEPANLDLFVTWWQFGSAPMSLTEIASMPAVLRHDVLYLLGELGRLRASRRKAKAPKTRG